MKNILVPTDFSECANYAIKFAAEIAKKNNSKIHVTHIYQRIISNDTTFNIELEADIVAKEKENFANYIEDLSQQDYMKGIEIESSLISLYKVWDILVMDKYADIDLIVMGSNGVDGITEFFVGSNAQKFVQMADCPVMVIKNETKLADIKTLVFASDFKKEVIPRFKVIQSFADSVGAELHYLKVMTPQDYSVEKATLAHIEYFVEQTGINASDVKLYQSVSIERGIIKYCKEINASMIAIETHGRTGLGHLLNDNVAEGLANHVTIPLFSVKIEEEVTGLKDVVTDFLSKKNLIAKA